MQQVVLAAGDRRKGLWLVIVGGVGAAFALPILSKLISGSFTSDIAFLFGNWIATTLISGVICSLVTRRAEWRHLRFGLTLLVSLCLLVAINGAKIRTFNQTKDALQTLSAVSGPADLQRKLDADDGNPVLAFTRYGVQAATASMEEIQQIMAKITPPELEAPVEFEKSSIDDLKRYRNALKIAEGNVAAAVPQVEFVYAQEWSKIKIYLDKASLDPDFKSSALRGVAHRHEDYKPYFEKFLKLKGEEFSLTGQLMSVLISEYGKFYRNNNGVFVFSNVSVVSGFNDVVRKIRLNEEAQADLFKLSEALDQRYQRNFQKFISSGGLK